MSTKKDDTPKPTILIQVLCIVALVLLFGISSFYKRDVPLPIYAIIAGILFGIGNINNLLGGGK